MIKKIKPYMMPIAMTVGGIFYPFFEKLSFLTPFLIFVMLFLTYNKLKFNEMKLKPLHGWMIVIQILGAVILYCLISPVNKILAQGVMICVLAPTATSAPVITGMLKGNVPSLTTYSLLSNLSVVVAAPLIFTLVGNQENLPFFQSLIMILEHILFLLLGPFLSALIIRKILPTVSSKIASISGLSFYLWSVALAVVTARTVQFILLQNKGSYHVEILIALGALVVCVSQFIFGRKLGRIFDDTIAGGQGLGQKNTILAIWMAQMYLQPISSIGPGAYVLWQNLINSYQVWRQRKTL